MKKMSDLKKWLKNWYCITKITNGKGCIFN